MSEGTGSVELQQLVQEEECEDPLSHIEDATPPSTPTKSQFTNKNDTQGSNVSQQVLWENTMQTSPIVSKGSSGLGTSQGSMVSGRAVNLSSHTSYQSRLTYLNEKDKHKVNRSEPLRGGRQHREVPDVRRMEQALLQLLEDFHSGNLQAFGKDCSMEQMTEIREQQERLARLHFELGQQEITDDESELRQSSANMRHLLHRLQQLNHMAYHKLKCAKSTTTLQACLHDTFQRIDYDRRLPFNALWESKHLVSVPLKSLMRKNVLGDENIADIMRNKPRVYMAPAVSLDDVEDLNNRKSIINFIYTTTSQRNNNEVYGHFKLHNSD